MIYLPEEKWSSRYNSEFYTVRMHAWHYVRNKDELSSLLVNATSGGVKAITAAGADDRGALHTPMKETKHAAGSSNNTSTTATAIHEYEDDSNEDQDYDNAGNNNNALHPTIMTTTTKTTTCTFLGISRPSSSRTNSCFCCHDPRILSANNGNDNTSIITSETRTEQQQHKKNETFPAVYYEIHVFIGRGGNTMIGRKHVGVVFRRYSQFLALCREMDADGKSSTTDVPSGSGSKRNNGSISDLLTKSLYPERQPGVFDWLQSHIQFCKLAWLKTVSSLTSSSSTSMSTTVGNDSDYYHQRMMGLHSFLHNLLCRQECVNNPSIEKFLGLYRGKNIE
jgi:hypothetical protein